MTSQTMSPLRKRMIEDMRIRGIGDSQRRAYILGVREFTAFLGRSPDTATPDDLRAYQLNMTRAGVKPSIYNSRLMALRFFFTATCGREDMTRSMKYRKVPRRLPVVLSPEEVAAVLEAAPGPGLKYRAALSIAYGAGLRAAEVAGLTAADIDSKQMLIRVEHGKGGKSRHVMLSPALLDLLREYWREARPQGWLFPGKPRVNPISTRQLNRAFNIALVEAGVTRKATLHTLRHSFATHLLEANVDVRVIQVLLGHAKISTTTQYTHVATRTIRGVKSPLDAIKGLPAAPI